MPPRWGPSALRGLWRQTVGWPMERPRCAAGARIGGGTMKRRTFDGILTIAGVGLTIFFIVAGSLGLWAYSFANSNVHNQLAEQQITFPPASAFAHAAAGTEITPDMIPVVALYAEQQQITGKQTEAYVDP